MYPPGKSDLNAQDVQQNIERVRIECLRVIAVYRQPVISEEINHLREFVADIPAGEDVFLVGVGALNGVDVSGEDGGEVRLRQAGEPNLQGD
jgi:hypothetical protein